MKNILAERLKQIDLKNRFQSFYNIKSNSKLKLIDFGIGQDNSIIENNAIEKLIKESCSLDNWKYAENGEESLTKSFIKFAFNQYGISLESSELFLSMGIKDALNQLAFILINPGDVVISTTPGYNVFQRKAKMLGGQVRELEINNENNYLPDIFTLKEEELDKVKVVLLNYPNNPTGAKCNKEYISRLVNLANKHDFIIINDGAYIDLCGSDNPLSFLSVNKSRIIELYSASKTFGMTGARLGFVAGNSKIIKVLKEYRDQENSGQFIPLQLAYKYCLDHVNVNEIRYKYLNRSKIVYDIMNKLGFYGDKYKGSFYLYFKCPRYIDEEKIENVTYLANILKNKYSILIIPYKSVNCFRVSLTYKNDSDPYILYHRLKECKIQYWVMAISNGDVNKYKVEIGLLVLVIISLFLAIDINETLIKIGNQKRNPTTEEQKNIRSKAELISTIYLVVSVYFSVAAYFDYKKKKSKANFYFFVAAVFLVIASLLRDYWIKKDTSFDEGAEDFVL